MSDQQAHPSDYLPELALGVLPEAEALPIRAHLAACQACAEEFAELERVAALLPLAAEAPAPPPATRDRLLARVRAAGAPARRPLALRLPLLQAAAGLLLLAIGLAAGWFLAHGEAGQPAALAERETLLAAAARGETLRATATSSSGIEASVLLAPHAGLGVAVLDGLPPAPPGRTYQAWLIEGSAPQSAGLLDAAGALFLAPGGDLRRFAAFALTLEAEGGAPAPTGDPLIVVPFALAAATR